MIYNILAVGDVVGESGLEHLLHHLNRLKKEKNIHFTVVNGENASGVGVMPQQVERMFRAGVDVVTLGNHSFGKQQLYRMLDEEAALLRPANISSRSPGHGVGVFDCGSVRIRVVNLIGRCELDFHADNPFFTMDRILKDGEADFTLVDFHAEASSEKLAMAYYLDGRVAALWGTHTHVPTADEEVFPKGMGYIGDLGMTGPVRSVLGIRPEQSVETFLGGRAGWYQTAEGPCKLQGAIFRINSETRRCEGVERVDIR